MTPSQLGAELHETLKLVEHEAREQGHDLHPWASSAPYSKRTACRVCGARILVTVTAEQVSIGGSPPIDCPGR